MEQSRFPTSRIVALVVLAIVVAVAAWLAGTYVKPKLSPASQIIEENFTFSFPCQVLDMTGVWQQWLLGVDGANAWNYVVACEMPAGTTITPISKNAIQHLPELKPGLHLIYVPDSNIAASINWYGSREVMQQKMEFTPGLRLYPVRFFAESADPFAETSLEFLAPGEPLTMVCHEELSSTGYYVNVCSVN